MPNTLITQDGKEYRLVEKPAKKKANHLLHWIIICILSVTAGSIVPYYFIFYILCIFEASRANRKNGY